MSLRAQSLKDIFTFTRASTATYFDINGVLTTAAVDEPRIDYDPVTLACRGFLIEEQRTNLILSSSAFATQNVTVTNVAHTLSFYGTGTIALTGTASPEVSLVGTGASTRVSLTFTPAAGTLTLTLTGSATQAQLEAGSYATSYIPTTTEAVTRAADICYTTTLEPWFSEAEGTVFVEYRVPWTYIGTDSGGHYIAEFDNGVDQSETHLIYHASGKPAGYTATGNSQQANPTAVSVVSPSVSSSVAYAWAENDVVFAATGESSVTTVSGSVTQPSGITTLRIGAYQAGAQSLHGHIRKIKFWPRRLSNTDLAALVA